MEQQIKAIENKLKTMENTPATVPEMPANFISPLSCVAIRPSTQPYSSGSRFKSSRGSRPYRSRGGYRDRRK